MSVDHKFSKNIVAFPASNGLTSVTLNIPNLIAPEDESGVAVYYNGQLLQRYTTGDTTSFAKFYYTLTNNNSAYVAAPTTVGIDTSCSATIVITANQDFVSRRFRPLEELSKNEEYVESIDISEFQKLLTELPILEKIE